MVILASQSPRRQELLKRIVPDFRVEPSGFNEKSVIERIPERLARQLAQGKAEEIAKRCPEDVVIGCDTIVVSPNSSGHYRSLREKGRKAGCLSQDNQGHLL